MSDNSDTKNAKMNIYSRWKKVPWEPLIAFNLKTEQMELVEPPYTYIDDNGCVWHVEDQPITGISI
ncbi:hypothetical protein KAX02_02945 [candidate division WOR-3 bacterium]|nr:hypothetical protein [candidate division WOR-3 bacterium]